MKYVYKRYLINSICILEARLLKWARHVAHTSIQKFDHWQAVRKAETNYYGEIILKGNWKNFIVNSSDLTQNRMKLLFVQQSTFQVFIDSQLFSVDKRWVRCLLLVTFCMHCTSDKQGIQYSTQMYKFNISDLGFFSFGLPYNIDLPQSIPCCCSGLVVTVPRMLGSLILPTTSVQSIVRRALQAQRLLCKQNKMDVSSYRSQKTWSTGAPRCSWSPTGYLLFSGRTRYLIPIFLFYHIVS